MRSKIFCLLQVSLDFFLPLCLFFGSAVQVALPEQQGEHGGTSPGEEQEQLMVRADTTPELMRGVKIEEARGRDSQSASRLRVHRAGFRLQPVSYRVHLKMNIGRKRPKLRTAAWGS
jgi:hypothetical protein